MKVIFGKEKISGRVKSMIIKPDIFREEKLLGLIHEKMKETTEVTISSGDYNISIGGTGEFEEGEFEEGEFEEDGTS